jgi:hypothetical protein
MRAGLIAALLVLSATANAGRGGRGFSGGHVTVHGGGGGARVVVHHAPPPAPVVRVQQVYRGPPQVQPVYRGSQVVYREHYVDYNRRPAVLIENYGYRAGYYWVAGSWQWDGREWRWYQGHFEIDPRYAQPQPPPPQQYNGNGGGYYGY